MAMRKKKSAGKKKAGAKKKTATKRKAAPKQKTSSKQKAAPKQKTAPKKKAAPKQTQSRSTAKQGGKAKASGSEIVYSDIRSELQSSISRRFL